MTNEKFYARFPSAEIFELLTTREQFAERFKRSFDWYGPIAMGMSDATVSKLRAEGAIEMTWTWLYGRRLKLNLTKFDSAPYFEREVIDTVRDILMRPLRDLALEVQMSSAKHGVIIICADGILSGDVGGQPRMMLLDAVGQQTHSFILRSLIAELKVLVSGEPFEFGRFGILAVVDDVLSLSVKPRVPIQKTREFVTSEAFEIQVE